MKKKSFGIALLGFLFLFPSLVQSQPDKGFERLVGIETMNHYGIRLPAGRQGMWNADLK
jgi:hypothetical protein